MNLFLFQPHGRHEQHTVINEDMLDSKAIAQLETDGKGVQVSFGQYDKYRQKAKQIHSDFMKEENRIKNSDNPMHTKDVKDYELKKAWEQLKKDSEALQAEWQAERRTMVSEAQAKAAKAVVHVSQGDKTTAEQMADRIGLDIAGAWNGKEVQDVAKKIAQDIGHLSDSEKTALQNKIPGILSQLESKADKYGVKVSTTNLINAARDIRNMDLLGGKVAEQLPGNVISEFNQTKLVRGKRPSTVRGY